MTGAGIIIAATVYITVRESRLGASKTPAASTD